ncbi:glycosyl hydrolases family 31-domain-containing protein [Suillus paluster]|uniref:glycosyl hydrolases family 31-domain-containing protein n=1 Tax=Suillus paluster TaxID=48578 RepID=UPI001B865CCE|nr:glycosyl hydrolases family 31-domain-containing protein [Suillus paluster]KAG1730127.1 glycosyl hydrolases family 31-domain-containing protein [Suillus paluster]
MFSLLLGVLYTLAPAVSGGFSSLENKHIFDGTTTPYAMNVTDCPGYTLGSLQDSDIGLTAQLTLAGPACNAFGLDISDLTIEVIYQSSSILHVKIYDTANQQFTIPESVIERPAVPTTSYTSTSDLVFNYDATPFAFWITRRSDPDAMPLFDTRTSSLPPTPIPPFNTSDPSTAFDGFSLVFEDQYLQVASALPYGTNIYGLGEVIASSGFRRDIGTDGGVGTIQTLWSLGVPDPIDQNLYGSHPIYIEHRYNATTGKASSSGVLLLSAAGSDIFLQTPPNSKVSLIEYRMIGGILDFYFFSGPTDAEVIAQYGSVIGYPMWQPAWGFGFHLCRWGYHNISDVRENVAQMRAAGIPLEVQWNDIDLYHAYRDFTTDPVSFPGDELREFIQELAANHQHYIPIVDAAIAVTVNSTDIYDPFTRGVEEDVWIKNPDGSLYISEVWPGYTVFPDWFSENTISVWTDGLKNWTEMGVQFSGIWLDMNELSTFCSYSCGTGANFSSVGALSDLSSVVVGYPECYNETLWGPSGNMTVNGISTYSCPANSTTMTVIEKRGVGAGSEVGVDLNNPPYAIHNVGVSFNLYSLASNATHYGGYVDLDVHNLFGLMEEKATHLAIQSILPGKRPFLISRSTFPSAGKWTGHWLGDNYSKWQYMYLNIQGVLQFQIYQIPMVGADTCGFGDNTDEELCNRWMQLSAFMPFYRNHNTNGALPQEPYRWPSVANASRIAIAARYASTAVLGEYVRYYVIPSLISDVHKYTLFANASMAGLPPIRALFYEFPDEPELFTVDKQWLVGSDILVTPVLIPGATTVEGIFPGRGSVIWRDWYTHAVVDATSGGNTTLDADISHINVHIRDNSALLLHQEPGYTIYETREGPYALLVSLNAAGTAFGNAYVDDGISFPPGPSRSLTFQVAEGTLEIESKGEYAIQQQLETITVLGVQKPTRVTFQGSPFKGWTYEDATKELVVSNASVDLNGQMTLVWR